MITYLFLSFCLGFGRNGIFHFSVSTKCAVFAMYFNVSSSDHDHLLSIFNLVCTL